jgi:hypothetical protein
MRFKVLSLGVVLFASSASATPKYAGTEISLGVFVSAISFDRAAELTYDPIFSTTLSADPHWQLNRSWSLVGHLAVDTEFTNADDTTRLRQPLLQDVFVEADWTRMHLPWDLTLVAGARLSLPASLSSIAMRRLFAIGPGASLTKKFHVGRVILGPYVGLRVTLNEQLSRATVYENPTIGACATNGGDCEAFDHSGTRASAASFVESLGMTAAFPHHLTGTIAFQDVQGLLYPLDPATNPVNGMPIGTVNGEDTTWRHSMVYVLSLEWDATPHWSVTGGFWTENPQLAPDSSYYAPFFNRYTMVFARTAYVF